MCVVFALDEVGTAEIFVEVVELVFVRHFVNQAQPQGIHRQERPLVDQPTHFVFGFLATVSDAADQLIVLAAIERVGHLAMGRREGLLQVGVDGALVIADMQEVGIGANPVERPAQEQLVAGDASEVERGRGQQVDTVSRRGQVILTVAGVLEPRVHVLAARPKVLQRVAHFLDARPEGRAQAARSE